MLFSACKDAKVNTHRFFSKTGGALGEWLGQYSSSRSNEHAERVRFGNSLPCVIQR